MYKYVQNDSKVSEKIYDYKVIDIVLDTKGFFGFTLIEIVSY